MQSSKKFAVRPRRAESYFGVYFDIPLDQLSTEASMQAASQMLETLLEMVKPDYIQCNGKDHSGLSSYPTRLGNATYVMHTDPLSIWRKITARYGVSLFIHYSSIWDEETIAVQPAWARVDAEGRYDTHNISLFSPYADTILIPQLEELYDVYAVDGVWIDADSKALQHDYTDVALADFRATTDVKRVSRRPESPSQVAFTAFCRESYRRYLRHYVDQLHDYCPGFQVASNGAFGTLMPEPVTAAVDFLSSDYAPMNSVNSIRLLGRCLAQQGKAWDLLAWSSAGKTQETNAAMKSIPQLQREAAIVLALGGGFQVHLQPDHKQAIFSRQTQFIQEIARFCRRRRTICQQAQTVPQIALLHAGSAYYQRNPLLFTADNGILDALQGTLQALLEAQNVVDILMEHQLSRRLTEYPLIIIPEWSTCAPTLQAKLREYVYEGGQLLLVGPQSAALFARELSISVEEALDEQTHYWLEHDGWLAGIHTQAQKVQLQDQAHPFGKWYASEDTWGPSAIAASIASYGKGQIAATYLNLGSSYFSSATWIARDFLNALVHQLFPEPLVKVTGSHAVDVSITRVQNKLAIHLINTAGPHADTHVAVFDEIPPVGPLTITIRSTKRPGQILLKPGKATLPFTWQEGKIHTTLDHLELHTILIVE